MSVVFDDDLSGGNRRAISDDGHSISRGGGWNIEPDFGVLNGFWLNLRDLFLAPGTGGGANDFAEHTC